MANSDVSNILSTFDKVVYGGDIFGNQIRIIRHYIEEGLIIFDSDDNHKWHAKIDHKIFPDLVKIAIADNVLRNVIKELNKKNG